MPEIPRPFAMNLAALPDGKVTIEDRTNKATPEPGLSKKEWESLRHVSATFYVGADRGNRPINRAGSCAADGSAYPTDVVDKRFRAMRTLLLKEKKASAADFEASRTIMEGWYGGKPAGEHSAAYQIIYKGPESAPRGEKTEKQFKEAMRHLASGVSALLCQDEVLVVFDVPEGKFTESYSGGAKDRQRADVLRTGEGFEGVRGDTKYAINYVLGRDTHTLVVTAPDRDEAYDAARTWLRERRFYSASLQGSCRVASQDDIDRFEKLDASLGGVEAYRGFSIERVEGAFHATGFATPNKHADRFKPPSKAPGRKIRVMYLVHYPDGGGSKTVTTIAQAREYIDNYLGPA